jgi:hypothetical protein
MDPKFPDFMLGELNTLVTELESAQQPSNIVLYEKVMHELRKQYDAQQEHRR